MSARIWRSAKALSRRRAKGCNDAVTRRARSAIINAMLNPDIALSPKSAMVRSVLHLGFRSYATRPAGTQRAVFQNCAEAVCQSNA
jgi:hypothetical protein